MFKILILSKDSDYSHKFRDIITSWELDADVIDTIPSSESTTVTLKYDLLIIDYPDHQINIKDNIKELKSRFDPVGIVVVIGQYNLLETLTFYELKWVHVHIKKHNFIKTQSFIKSVLDLKRNRDLFLNSQGDSQEIDSKKYKPYVFISKSSMVVLRDALAAAKNDRNVMLLGETGVGKEIFAEIIHRNSQRGKVKNAFVTVNSSSFDNEKAESYLFGHIKGAFTGAYENKDGFFSDADKGTLFLDEFADMQAEVQPKLLRVLGSADTIREFYKMGDTKKITSDVRIIAATNKIVEGDELDGFRKDLLERFPWIITIPPLRERQEEILPLIEFFLKNENDSYKRSVTISDAAIELLLKYNYPRNIRELKNIIVTAYDRCNSSRIETKHLEKKIQIL